MNSLPVHMQVNSPELRKQHEAHKERMGRFTAAARREAPPAITGEDACMHVWEWRQRQRGLYGFNPQADAHVRTRRAAADRLKGPGATSFIIAAVSAHFDVPRVDILSSSRLHPYVLPRQVAMYLCRKFVGHSFPEIGRRFGRDHTTALHNCQKIEAMIADGPPIARDVDAICRKLGGPQI
ncbi:hypothetical protein GGQ86_002998 [Xanthobacter flavus]|uniref:Chromosomal replication initiator DnaA C-terminal domain-containing protein n=1 Tax=Xanthobacter flavus TaxID=281 RepID=A0A9W6CPN1_XANFL|nr:helix-turn-helix domain-containing protein [Xanthobacter flavus]MDR6334516.1 hypothetical protein [Xanthobacter flavus]GLI23465.1 hypothetical protein XFLAVUS301_31390 [Xanthobacter flavus]